MTRFAHLAQRLFNVPLAIHPQKAEIVVAALAERLGIARIQMGDMAPLRASAAMVEDSAAGDMGRQPRDKPYEVAEGIAVIEVSGTLVQKLGSLRPYSGMTGYDGIRACFVDAIADTAIRAVVLHIDSPGGEVAGCFDLADLIHSARGRKPIHAILCESAFSAAYALASACDRVTVPRTGGVGSVGVIAMLVDMSRALEAGGLTVNIIQFGAHKADGQPTIALAPDARARFQAQIDTMGEIFVATVARNRGMAAAAVRATQADTYLGAAGVAVGFADAEMDAAAAFRTLLSSL